MNETAFGVLLSQCKYRQLDANTWFVVSTGNSALGTTARRSQRYYKLADGLVYTWWQLKLAPPEVFSRVDAQQQTAMLAELPDAHTLVDAIWNESVHT
jgi:hypothetical protein